MDAGSYCLRKSRHTAQKIMPSQWTSGALAGLTGIVLYIAALTPSPLSGLATLVAPLPLYFAGLSSGALAAAIGAGIAGVASMALTEPAVGAFYVLVVGLPAVGLSYLLLLNRDSAAPDDTIIVEWYPAGRVLSWLTLAAASLFLITVMGTLDDEGGLRGRAREMFVQMAPPEQLQATIDRLQVDVNGEELIEFAASTLPTALVVYLSVLAAINAGLAQFIAVRTGQALRPSPAIKSMTLPPGLDIVLALCIALSLIPGEAGFIGASMAFIVMTPYFLLGLVVIHVISRHWPGRGFLLTLFYLVMFLIPAMAFLIAALGLTEQCFGVRRRYAAKTANQQSFKGK